MGTVSRMTRVFTIGVYGTDKDAFFDALRIAEVDVLLDIRRRRAVRGARYAFANARRLTHELQLRGIGYLHLLDLAPDRALLALQHAADARAKVLKSQRTELDPGYIERYLAILDRFDFASLARTLHGVRAPVLFCIERIPSACHRSLVAPRLAEALGTGEVVHLIPETAA
jgi:uncharacterized protein (DUF488 family)